MDLLQFTGGLSTTASSFVRGNDVLDLAINVHGDQVGSITKRLGYAIIGSAVSNSAIKGLFSYSCIAAGTTYLYAATNGNIAYYNGSVWTNLATYSPAAAIIDMRVYLDQLFIVGADTTPTYITPTNISNLTVSTATNLNSAPKAKYVEVFQDQLFFGNVTVSGVRFASRFYYSSVPDVNGTSTTWPTTNWDDVMTNNGEEITALHTNKAWNQMLIFKDTSCHAWDGNRVRDIGNIGTSNFRSVKTLNAVTYFYSQGRGIYSLQYAYMIIQPQLISRTIEKWVFGIVDPTVVHAGESDERYYKLYIGNTVVDGVTYTNCELRYAILDNTWTVYSYADNFTVYAEFKISNVTRIFGGTDAGKVMQLAQNVDTVYSDNGVAIAAEFMTKPLDIQQPENKKFSDRGTIFTTAPQNLQGRMKGGGDWTTWFSIDKKMQDINLSPADARLFQFHFSESSTTSPFIFQGISFTGGATTNYA